METYYKTWNDGKVRTHLEGISDLTLCGFDISGDDMIHDREPEQLPPGKRYRVTCPDCKMIIKTVQGHLLSNKPNNLRKIP